MDTHKEEINEILDALKNGVYEDLDESQFYYDVVQPFADSYTKPYQYDTGATKGVLLFKDLGFVIKIPFCRNSDTYDEYYECCDYFTGADADNGWDYCEAEAYKYNRAELEGLNECFAKCEKIAEIDGYPIYIQEYAEIYRFMEDKTPHNEEETSQVSSICNSKGFYIFNLDWLSDVFYYFGEKVFYKLLDFIDLVGINDLHDKNIGYIGDRPVLVDYSSYDQ